MKYFYTAVGGRLHKHHLHDKGKPHKKLSERIRAMLRTLRTGLLREHRYAMLRRSHRWHIYDAQAGKRIKSFVDRAPAEMYLIHKEAARTAI